MLEHNKKNILLALLLLVVVTAVFIFLKGSPPTAETLNTSKVLHEQPEEEPQLTIVSFGDSLTAGYGVVLEDSYPSVLQRKLVDHGISAEVINMGVSGETTAGAVERIEFVAKQNPSLVLLGIGANDMLRGSSPEEARANIEKILTYFKENNIDVLILGMKSVSSNGVEYGKKFDAIYKELAEKYSFPLVPFFLEGVALNRSLNTDDGIHPNKEGYEKIVSENILPVLLPLLK